MSHNGNETETQIAWEEVKERVKIFGAITLGVAAVTAFALYIANGPGHEGSISEIKIDRRNLYRLADKIFDERCQTEPELKKIVEVVAYINGRGPPQSAFEEAARQLAK